MQAMDPRDDWTDPGSAALKPSVEQERIKSTFGNYNQTTPWTDVRSLTWRGLIDVVTGHRTGTKEGTCIVPAIFRGIERKKEHADRIDVAFLDSDTGANLAEICIAIAARGWAAAVSSTHSHMTIRTKVKRTDWDKFLNQADNPVIAAEQFLVQKKDYPAGVAAEAYIASEDQHYVTFAHQPCPKFRVVLLLQRPWLASDYPTQAQANLAWKNCIEALAAALGLNHDQACTDTSRLFFLPRRLEDGPPREIAVVDGTPCDIFALPVLAPGRSSESRQAHGSDAGGPGESPSFTNPDGTEFDLLAWVKACGAHFEIVSALQARRPDIFVGKVVDTNKHHIHCPNEDAHTQGGEDHATFCMNASASSSRGFVIHCRHGHCDGRDRLLFVRQMLEQGWLTVPDLTAPRYLSDNADQGPADQVEGGQPPSRPELSIGSDVEIASRVVRDLIQQFKHVIHDEGEFWRYANLRWEPIPQEDLWKSVFVYDGAGYRGPKGEPSNIKVGKGRVESVIACMVALLHRARFFANAPTGINCASGFITFGVDGAPKLCPHDPEHRHRHILAGRWPRLFTKEQLETSLLRRLLNGCFKGDDDGQRKKKLLGEIAGVAALGQATRMVEPKAIVLVGKFAENGKSQILAVLRALLPKEAVSNISPAKFDDRTYLCQLPGKLLNAPDELAGTDAIASEIFKQVITGEPVMARDVYRPAFEFQPRAQHVYATNNLPTFKGGMDRGVRRRLTVLPLNRVIPREERIERIGQRIGEEEPDLLLDWAVRGAQRVIAARAFNIPSSCASALLDWIYSSDPVLAWLESDEIGYAEGGFVPETPVKVAHRTFIHWASDQGFDDTRLPAINGFSQRVEAAGKHIVKKRLSDGPRFVGLACKGHDPGPRPAGRW